MQGPTLDRDRRLGCRFAHRAVLLFPTSLDAAMRHFADRGLEPHIVDTERRFGFEDHLAFEVARPDGPTFERLLTAFRHDAGLAFEGGGHNPHEGLTGSTVLHFVGEGAGTGPSSRPGFRRFELYCKGDFPTVVDRHPVEHGAVELLYSTGRVPAPVLAQRRLVLPRINPTRVIRHHHDTLSGSPE